MRRLAWTCWRSRWRRAALARGAPARGGDERARRSTTSRTSRRWTAHPGRRRRARDLRPTTGVTAAPCASTSASPAAATPSPAREVDLDSAGRTTPSRFRIRGEAPPNHLEFKLIDASGENVWWSVRRDVEFPREWRAVHDQEATDRVRLGAARAAARSAHVAAIEFAITAGSGGAGTVWIDDLDARRRCRRRTRRRRRPWRARPRRGAGTGAALALDGDPTTAWRPAAGDRAPWLALDLGGAREYGGLVLDWAPVAAPRTTWSRCRTTGATWRVARTVTGGNGGRDYLYLPETESRHLRVRLTGGPEATRGAALAEITIEPLAWSATREDFFQAIAADAPRGLLPARDLGRAGRTGRWSAPTTTREEVLLSEDGAIETRERAASRSSRSSWWAERS